MEEFIIINNKNIYKLFVKLKTLLIINEEIKRMRLKKLNNRLIPLNKESCQNLKKTKEIDKKINIEAIDIIIEKNNNEENSEEEKYKKNLNKGMEDLDVGCNIFCKGFNNICEYIIYKIKNNTIKLIEVLENIYNYNKED